jgi:hypothetical protein
VILGPLGQSQDEVPPEDPSPSDDKVCQDSEGDWTITDVSGLKLAVRWKLDGTGYDISKSKPAPLSNS